MNILRSIIAIIFSLILPFSSAFAKNSSSQVFAYQEDFEDGLAQGWTLEPGWEVQPDGDNYVLAGSGHVWARSNQSFTSDYSLTFRLQLLNGTIHLVYRLADIGRYFIGFTADGSYLSKQYWPDEFHEDLAQSATHHALNTWHQIEIIGQGGLLSFIVDGKQEWTYTDPQPLPNSSFAFETLDDSQAFVDDIAVSLITAAQATATYPASQDLTWVRLGGPLGGLGYDIRMLPGNPDRTFVTDAWAGVFSSTDGGQTWFPSSDGITTRTGPTGDAIPVFSLTIDPNDPSILWAGTQYTRGIFKSTDGGQSWIKMDSGIIEREGISFRGFTVDPSNSDIVYAAAEISSWAWTPDARERIGREFDLTAGVVYKTVNGGQSWNSVWRGNNLARYIWINPDDTNIIYISTGIFDREAANSDPLAGLPGGEGILKSMDGGLTWNHVNNGLDNLYVGSLFMHPDNPDILLAGTGNNQYMSGAGVYLSRDGGNSWELTLPAEGAITSVEITTSDPNIAFAAGRFAVYRSTDGGNSWKRITVGDNPWGAPGVQTGFPIDFQVDPRNPDHIFTNAYGGGAFESEDGGRTWQDASKGYTGAQVRDISVNPIVSGNIVAAARSGVFASLDGGANWIGINPTNIDSLEWNAIKIDPLNPQHIIGGLNVNGLLVGSLDGGRTWNEVESTQTRNVGWRVIAFAPSNPKIVYAGTAGFYSAGSFSPKETGIGIFASRDGGAHWSVANDSLTQDAHVSALAVDPSDPRVVYAGTTNHGLLKTTDGGVSWAEIQNGVPAQSIVISTAISPDDGHIILVGIDRGGVYRSTDGGQTWNHSASGLNPEASVSSIIFDPVDTAIVYLADALSGVYRSTDGGVVWNTLNNGLLSRAVNALAISSDGLHLYAATEGSGVYRLDLNGMPPQTVQITPTSQPTVHPIPTTPTRIASTLPTGITPTARSTTVNLPSPTPAAKTGICGSIAVVPLAIIGVLWVNSWKKIAK